MSHSKEEEDVEDIACILDHLVILEKQILKMRQFLVKGDLPTKQGIMKQIEETKKEAEGVVNRLNYMLKDMRGEL